MIFFGTSAFSIHVLDRLIERGMTPDVIVTVPDRPAGRKMLMTPPPVKVWAAERGIHCIQFEKLNAEAVAALKEISASLPETSLDIFIVASYGKIIPQSVLDIPAHGALNVHPSLLPKLRGATPLQSSILEDMQHTGVTIIKMDKEMDHGPIVAQWEENMDPWPMNILDLEKTLAIKGADILAEALPPYVSGELIPFEQDHSAATFTKKIQKEDGFIKLATNEDADEAGPIGPDSSKIPGPAGYQIYLKYQALSSWPGLFFFARHKDADIRVKVRSAAWNEATGTAPASFEILRVVPEGKSEMSWKEFANYIKN
ncbi:MAG TPA: methionyl-tRNA formyltransferase [Candidatus Paceibacterota bacterium]